MLPKDSYDAAPPELGTTSGDPTQKTLVDLSLARPAVPERSPDGSGGGGSGPGGLASTQTHHAIQGGGKPFAEGAMGMILLAEDMTLGRTVVLKVLQPKHQEDGELRRRFRREAAVTAQLQHPGVPPVFGIGTLADARPFFSMTLVQGRTLAQLLAESTDRRRDRPRFLKVFEQVCQTIAFAHSRGVIHRDLKPENIVVGDYGVVYVMDWGIARVKGGPESGAGGRAASPAFAVAADETLALTSASRDLDEFSEDTAMTVSGDLLGTPQYMSPEQARRDDDQDERTDVFGLGAILFEILVGEPLRPATVVARDALERFSDDHLATAPTRLAACGADSPVVDLVGRCLQRDREQRPADGSEVASLVTAYLLHVLKRPERELARFFELSLDLFCLAGLDGYFKQVNQNFTQVLGYSTEELLSRPFVDYVHPDDRAQTLEQVARLSQGLPVVHFENRYRDREGRYKWFEWAAKSIREEGIVFAAAREITNRKQLEQRMQASVESSPVATVLTGQDGRIVLINQAVEAVFGYRREELLGQPVEILIPERFRAHHPALRAAYLANPLARPGSGRELLGRRKDGTEIPIELGLSPFETEEGVFVISTIVDLRPRRRDEARYRAVVEACPAAMLLIDADGKIRLVNRAAEAMFGESRGVLIGQSAQRLMPGLRTGDSGGLAAASGLEARLQDGSVFPVEVRADPLEYDGARYLLVVVLDRSRPAS